MPFSRWRHVLFQILAADNRNAATNSSTVLEVDVCFGMPLFSYENGVPVAELFRDSTRDMAAILLAVEHINNQDCSILGAGCQKLLAAGGKPAFSARAGVSCMRSPDLKENTRARAAPALGHSPPLPSSPQPIPLTLCPSMRTCALVVGS